ncbi:MAG TPA: HAMP domain-containing protein, partial [Candidatus Binatia bacterium]
EQRRTPFPAEPRQLRLAQGEIYEVTVPILEGRIGVVRLGVWRDAVDAEISETVMLQIKIIALVFAAGMVLAILLAWRINRPILRLVNAARSISRGELDTPSLGVEDTTEFGELSRALERMRSSLKAAMIRLTQER